jgi:hypothetical protein
MSWIIQKYIQIAGLNLRNFKRQDAGIYRSSCPFCGDSSRDKTKARFYFLESTKGWRCYCHHCQWSGSFDKFLKKQDPNLYNEYRMEMFRERGLTKVQPLPELRTKTTFRTEPKKSSFLDKFTSAVEESPALEYIQKRKVPERQWRRLRYIDDIRSLTEIIPKYKGKIPHKSSRLMMPCYDLSGKLIGMICRALDPRESLRYLTLAMDDETVVFGMDVVDLKKTVRVTEGPIDSLFLSNALAVSGTAMGKIGQVLPGIDKSKLLLILDNQPRNREVLKVYEKVIGEGYKTFIPPKTFPGKDLNDCVLNGLTLEELDDMIVANSFTGLQAKLRLSEWREI